MKSIRYSLVKKWGGLILSLLFLFFACKKDDEIGNIKELKEIKIPEHFPTPHYTFQNNTFSEPGFELGRKLFYDKNLSSDKKVSCASCHNQAFAFSDPGKPVSEGVEGRVGRRNSPAMFNLIWHKSFMWDGGVNHIEVMPLAPLQEPEEMDMDLNDIISYLEGSSEYKKRFSEVFENAEINTQNILFALTQFMGALTSSTSKYDEVVNGEQTFSVQEQKGFDIFQQHCSSCHTAPLFMDNMFHNNGIDAVFSPDDLGRYEITLNSEDSAKFKTPSLRNIALTYPYMHDGRFYSLEEVIDFYSEGISANSNLSEKLPPGGFDFSNHEKQALLSFLNTLTDWEFVYDIRFSNPN